MDVGRTAGDPCTEVVLGDDFDGEVVFLDINVGAVAYGFHQSALDFRACVVGVVQDAELGVAALAVQVELPVLAAVEVHTPVDQLLNLCRCVPDHLLDGLAVGDEVACNHGVLNVLVEVVKLQVRHRGHAALRKRGVGLVEAGFADHAHAAFLCPGHLQGVAHAGHAGTNH